MSLLTMTSCEMQFHGPIFHTHYSSSRSSKSDIEHVLCEYQHDPTTIILIEGKPKMLDIFFVQLCLVVGVCLYLCSSFVVIVQIHFRTMTVNQYLNLLIVQYFSITADLYFSFFPVFEYWKKNGHGFIFIYINLNCTFKQRP